MHFPSFHPTHHRRPAQIFNLVGHRPVVGSGQVVVGQGFEVDDVVVPFFRADLARGFHIRVAHKEVRA
jgi:hypothetical protein